jgi:hypothetical protein
MTVTLSRQSAGGGGGGGTGVRRTISCKKCDTKYVIDVEPPGRIHIEVAGGTCRECNPELSRSAPERSPAGRAPSPAAAGKDVRIAWRTTEGNVPVLVVVRIDTSSRAADRRRIEVPAPAERPGHAATVDPVGTLRNEAAATIAATLGPTTGALIKQAWRPEYCRMVAAQADALRAVMEPVGADSIDGLRITIRLLDAPPLVAALTIEVFARLVGYHQDNGGKLQWPIWELAYALEASAMVVCCGTGHLGHCATAVRVAVRWGEGELTPERMTRIIRRWFAVILAANSGLVTFEVTVEALSSRGDTLRAGHIRIQAGSPPVGVDRVAAQVVEAEGAFPRHPIVFGDAG